MKLPGMFQNVISRKKFERKLFLSLLVDPHYLCASVWYLDQRKKEKTVAVASVQLKQDTWNHRKVLIDRLLSTLEKTVESESISNVILGLPATYLTQDGNIKKDIRTHIKELTKAFELKPVGFVSTYEAIIHVMKKDEGIPVSAILLGVSGAFIDVHVYKIGKLIGYKKIQIDQVSQNLEKALTQIEESEVLPSRMLLYGVDSKAIHVIKEKLLKHPWQSKLNILHFPKITVLNKQFPITAISSAGSSELVVVPNEYIKDEQESVDLENHEKQTSVETSSITQNHVQSVDKTIQENKNITNHDEKIKPDNANIDTKKDITGEESNVQMVDPKSLGFQAKSDSTIQLDDAEYAVSHEERKKQTQHKKEVEDNNEDTLITQSPKERVLQYILPFIKKIQNNSRNNKILFGLGTAFIVIIISAILMIRVLPKASVTIVLEPKHIQKEHVITLSLDADEVDIENKILPAKLLEQTIEGEKTIETTGSKEIGTPSTGTVTIYNKSTTSKVFEKGTVLTVNSLEFLLDDDISVASASENLVSGTVTFGKKDVQVTSSGIGEKGNIGKGSEFTMKGISSSIAVARNDEGFEGGTSKEVTVVSRADQDALVKALTNDLVEQAKQQLLETVGGGDVLIDETIETAVEEKQFVQELGEESIELSGVVTVSVEGLAYSKDVINSYIEILFEDEFPDNYQIQDDTLTINIEEVEINDDETIMLSTKFEGYAIPLINEDTIKKEVVGMDIDKATQYIEEQDGVKKAMITIKWSLFGRSLPSTGTSITLQLETELE
ncbi:hypothetical protein ACFL1P_00045 [Patescibacteria group bacterium]